ncbi:hypothetical protein PHET_00765 [Paragonimus heterotremus]|uniref:Uncharacterized protein n=1 Tax=Paragonimus heterotremus TaxID=100268 RepID=A0A8J4WKV8_9TREM|nr:hypothetical protein PHET_00765 [Paragonimus heterotremus]
MCHSPWKSGLCNNTVVVARASGLSDKTQLEDGSMLLEICELRRTTSFQKELSEGKSCPINRPNLELPGLDWMDGFGLVEHPLS